jgi:hypothetical protein
MRFRSRSPSMWPTFLKVVELAGLPSPPLEHMSKQITRTRIMLQRLRSASLRAGHPQSSSSLSPPERQSSRSLRRHHRSALRRQSLTPAFNHPEAHTTILRPPVGSQSAATLPLNKDPGVTDRAPLNARFTGTPVVHRRCGLRWWDQRDSTAQHRRRLHQAESLGLFGRPLERG